MPDVIDGNCVLYKIKIAFSLSIHKTFIRINLILAHKGNLIKFQKVKFGQELFSDCSTIKLKINGKSSNQQPQTL
jgi:hypothetical protein